MTIALPPEIEQRLQGEAARQGLGIEELAAKLIAQHLSAHAGTASLGDLFAEWDREDRSSDPQELARRHRELEELKQAITRNRLEMEGPDSRKPFP